MTHPKIADVQVLTPEQVLVQGLKVGSTDLILWSEDEQKTWQRRVAEVSRQAVKALGVNTFMTDDDFFFGQRVGSSSGGPLVLRKAHEQETRRTTDAPPA